MITERDFILRSCYFCEKYSANSIKVISYSLVSIQQILLFLSEKNLPSYSANISHSRMVHVLITSARAYN